MTRKFSLLLSVMIVLNCFTLPLKAQQIVLPENRVWGLAWNPDGSEIATGLYDGTVTIRDSTSGQVTRTLEGGVASEIIALVWSPDGTKLAGSNGGTSVFVWSSANGQLLNTLVGENTCYIFDLSWGPDSIHLAGISSVNFLLQIWNVNTGDLLVNRRGSQEGLDWFENQLVIGSGNGISILDSDNGDYIKGVGLHVGDITALAWSPDGSKIASGSMDASVRIWDSNTILRIDHSQPIYILSGHTLPVTSVDWNIDGTRLASASYDGSIRIWNPANGQLLETIEAGAPVLNAQWSPDGSRLAYSGDVDGLGGEAVVIPTPSLPTSTPIHALTNIPTVSPTPLASPVTATVISKSMP